LQGQPRRTIFHVDLDAFYVSAETRRDPSLRGTPVVVGADPEEGQGRGVVITCSYEARKFGLRSGMPISRAWRLCPGAHYLRPDFALYEAVSESVMATLRKFADRFEQVGIDEAFLDVSARAKSPEDAKALAARIKQEMLLVHGLTCSIGIGPNKSTAKIASDRQKPDGLTIVPLDSPTSFLAPLPVSAIPGVGFKTQEFLKSHGIETIEQLQGESGKRLMTWFGKTGVWLWGVANGLENIPVRPREMPKSLSVERTFRADVLDFSRVEEEARNAADELHRRILLAHLLFRVVGIKIRFQGFQTHTREKTVPGYTLDKRLLQDTALSLLNEFKIDGRPVRLVGVRVSGLQRESAETSTLDGWT
jgi:DNA polymerase IV (DinB-like DNA polymerase)